MKALPRPESLDRYDPEHGLKSIAVAEAAEKHFTRAKDATHLSEAVELKLSEQRKFVLWWDASEKPEGGRGKTHNRSVKGLPDPMVIHRWRTRLKDAKKFTAAVIAAQEKCVRVCEARKGATDQRGASGTNENEWYTPKQYVEAARDVLGAIDLDPASAAHAQKWIRAGRFFTKEQDGLQQEWPGRVWLNPPYMQPAIAQFIAKLVEEVRAERTTAAVLLTHNYTDTAWFHLAAGACAAICFTRGRIAFLDPNGAAAAPTQGQAFIYFGDNPASFSRRFSEIGFVMSPATA